MRICFFGLLLGYSLLLSGQGDAFSFTSDTGPIADRNFFRLGDKVLMLVRHGEDADKPYILLSLHNNESTAIRAAKEFIEEQGGTFYELVNNGERNISFELMDKTFLFDPNRIFTSRGIEENLKLYGSRHKIAREQLINFSRFILTELPEDKIIIAVHNNTDGNYNITNYTSEGELAKDAKAVFINPAIDLDDFYLTNNTAIYNQLKELSFNVVLLSHKAKDDGSLSIYCTKTDKTYINIETQDNHFEEQEKMLRVAEKILK